MGGRASKQKGSNSERQVRDYFRDLGWTSDRVVLSGAHVNHPGDVKICKGDLEYLIEVKNHKSGFKRLYTFLSKYLSPIYFYVPPKVYQKYQLMVKKIREDIVPDETGRSVVISLSHNDMHLEPNAGQQLAFDAIEEVTPEFRQILNLEKLIKGSNFLMVRTNHKPWIFIKFF
jgi:Holliday junction resolvase